MINRTDQPDSDHAEQVAIRALQYIASDPDLLDRFMAITGLETNELRDAVRVPGFFAGVLDFLLADEPSLLAFAANVGIDPKQVGDARAVLGTDYR